jgi:hypothetical protein
MVFIGRRQRVEKVVHRLDQIVVRQRHFRITVGGL